MFWTRWRTRKLATPATTSERARTRRVRVLRDMNGLAVPQEPVLPAHVARAVRFTVLNDPPNIEAMGPMYW